jgi:hypothetical protein
MGHSLVDCVPDAVPELVQLEEVGHDIRERGDQMVELKDTLGCQAPDRFVTISK